MGYRENRPTRPSPSKEIQRNIFLEWISQYEKDNREVLTTEVLEGI